MEWIKSLWKGTKQRVAEEEKGCEFESEGYQVGASDKFFCEYDSTRETEEGLGGPSSWPKPPQTLATHKFDKFKSAARDMQNDRHSYLLPHLSPQSEKNLSCLSKPVSPDMPNLKFYLGERPSVPDAIRYLVRRDEECRGEPETNGISEELEGGHSEGPAEANPGGRPVDFMSERPAAEEEKSREFESEWYRVETTDELFCEYDSTWETEEGPRGAGSRSNRPRTSASHKFDKFKNAARDMQNYRRGYPFGTRTNHWNKAVFQDDMSNLKFYLGERPSVPDGVYIKDFHTSWKGQYDVLECVHTFIQWLFPLEEQGMNYEARTLTKAEIEEFLKNPVATANLLESYKLMLDFYGIKLSNEATGEVTRAPNWRARFKNLNRNTHNNLRITRILKCLGILGYRHYQAPLVHFFLEETLVHRELQNIKDSVLNYFMFAVLNRRERRNLIKFAYLNYEPKHEFVWCPQKIQAIWLSQLCPDHREMREHDLSHSAVSEYK